MVVRRNGALSRPETVNRDPASGPAEDSSGPLCLSDDEREALMILTIREQELNRLLGPLRSDAGALHRAIETRLGLRAGAIGTSHGIDPAGVLVALSH